MLPATAPTPYGCAISRAAADDPEYDKRLDEAGRDSKKLWRLYEWCISTDRDKEGKSVLRRLVKADPDHQEARDLLGHVRHEGEWFTSQKKLDAHIKKQRDKEAKARGWVKYKGEWADPADVIFLKQGLVKIPETGEWITKEDRRRMDEGWSRQDLTWVSPDEVENISKGLWKIDDQWVPLEEANRLNAEFGRWWRIPSEELHVWSKADREVALEAQVQGELALRDMERFFGVSPSKPLKVAILRSQEQYDRFAMGNEEFERPPASGTDLFTIHSAFFAESWFDRTGGGNRWLGAGAGYWDASTDDGNAYGPHAARLAAALSYIDYIDPSPEAVEAAVEDGPRSGFPADFWKEKRLPEWLRYGTAVYAERYFQDSKVKRGGDPHWPRKWSLENLKNKGGLRNLREVLRARLNPNAEGSLRSLIEWGLCVAYILDGENPDLAEAHREFREAFLAEEWKGKHIDALEKALEKNEAGLRSWAGLE